MTVLVIAEHDNHSIKGATLNVVTAAKAIGGDVHVLVAGANAGAAAAAAAQIAGVAKVLHADSAAFADSLAENVAAQVLAVASSYSHILFPATASGKNVAPRVAAKLDVAQVSEITKVVSPDTFERPIYAGNAIATVQSADATKVLTVRGTAFDGAAATGGSAAVESLAAVADSGKSAFVGREVTKEILKKGGVDFSGAKPVVTVLGLTFKENVSDIRNTKVVDIVSELETFGFEVQVTDPVAYPEEAKHEYHLELVPREKLKPACGVVLAVSHEQFKRGGWELVKGLLKGGKGVVADLKNVLPREAVPEGVALWRL